MNNRELVVKVSEKMETDYETANKLVSAIIDVVSKELINKGRIKLVDFGVFEVVQRAPRKGFNPYYRKETVIPACLEPVFRPGLALKTLINK